jgi:hypothetical protein
MSDFGGFSYFAQRLVVRNDCGRFPRGDPRLASIIVTEVHYQSFLASERKS